MNRSKTALSIVVALLLLSLIAGPAWISSADARDRDRDRDRWERHHDEDEDREHREDRDEDDEHDEDEEEWEEEEEWGEFEELREFVERLEAHDRMLELIQTTTEIASDAGSAGVAAIFAAEEYVHEEEDRIQLFEEALKECKHPVIRRVLRMKLAELYGHEDQSKKAIQHLRPLLLGNG